jgi:Ca2+-binding RTX toxin-like protein
MTGNGGGDQFGFSKPGSANVVVDYADGTDEILVSSAGFNLGFPTPFTPTPLPAGLFVAYAAGSFGSAAQRFAYNTGNGKLFFDKDGNRPGSAAQLVATLTGDPTLTNLFFVA